MRTIKFNSAAIKKDKEEILKLLEAGKLDKATLALWAADCAERVLPWFEKAFPSDPRPRRAIETGRAYARTGVFRMAEIRGASLAAHAAAREAPEDSTARFAARAAGQAVATAHVSTHSIGATAYAAKAIRAADPPHAEERIAAERKWQYARLADLAKAWRRGGN